MNTLRKLLIATATIGAAASLAGAAAAQDPNAGSADIGVSANLIAPLSIDPGDDLDFGDLALPSTFPQNIVMSATGTRTAPSTIEVPGGNAGSNGTFVIKGEAGQDISIEISAVMDDTTHYDLGAFTASGCTASALVDGVGTGKAAAGPTGCTLKVGATLTIKTGATAGPVSGTLTTAVAYN